VILTTGYFSLKALKTGTVIATSPIAESLITAICSIDFDKKESLNLSFRRNDRIIDYFLF